ncbi:MAG: class F sortase [Actinomycetota bacterium]
MSAGAHSRHTVGHLATNAIIALLTIGGVACVGLAATGQQHAPQPPLWNALADSAGSDKTSAGLARAASPSAPPSGKPARRSSRPATALNALAPGSRAAPRKRAPRASAPPAVAGRGSAPVWLSIPSIGVKARLLSLGLTAKGALEVPPPGRHYNDAGWYRYSVTPGSIGPAVIVGHVDSASKGPSVFFRLGGLNVHDIVSVARADGSVAVFAIDDVRRYHKAQFPTRLVYGNTSKAALRLITCGGKFDRASGHYIDNVVVFATLVRLVPRPPAAG